MDRTVVCPYNSCAGYIARDNCRIRYGLDRLKFKPLIHVVIKVIEIAEGTVKNQW